VEPKEGQFKFDSSMQKSKKFAPDSHVTVIRPLTGRDIPEKTHEYPEAEHYERAAHHFTTVQRSEDEGGRDMYEGHSLQRSPSSLLPGHQSGSYGFGVAFSKDPNKARQRAFNRASTDRLEQTTKVKEHMERSGKQMKDTQKHPTPVVKINSAK
jgi:hypothetical protein